MPRVALLAMPVKHATVTSFYSGLSAKETSLRVGQFLIRPRIRINLLSLKKAGPCRDPACRNN